MYYFNCSVQGASVCAESDQSGYEFDPAALNPGQTILICSGHSSPCALELQMPYTSPADNSDHPVSDTGSTASQMVTVEDFAAVGITHETTGQAVAFGFGVVVFFAVFGYVVGLAVRMIRKI